MINLELLGACQNCPNLEPVKASEFGVFYESKNEYHSTITCENIDKCRALLEHLEKEVKKDGN